MVEMIQATAGTTFNATATGAEPGLLGSITIEVYDPTSGQTIIAPRTTGITEPRPGSYATALSVPSGGTFSIRWTYPSDVGVVVAEEPLTVYDTVAVTPAYGVIPTVGELGSLMRARTRDRFGNEVGTFTDDTRPTGEQAAAMIAAAVDLLPLNLANLDEALTGRARRAILLLAAVLVENSFYPEQADTDQSAAATYERLYDLVLTSLQQGDPDPSSHAPTTLA